MYDTRSLMIKIWFIEKSHMNLSKSSLFIAYSWCHYSYVMFLHCHFFTSFVFTVYNRNLSQHQQNEDFNRVSDTNSYKNDVCVIRAYKESSPTGRLDHHKCRTTNKYARLEFFPFYVSLDYRINIAHNYFARKSKHVLQRKKVTNRVFETGTCTLLSYCCWCSFSMESCFGKWRKESLN